MDIYDLDMRPGLPEELERLKAENERLRKAHEHAIEDCKLLKVTREENERLRKKIELNSKLYAARDRGIEKDAERYRWLKAQHDNWESSWRVYQPHPTLGSVAIDQGLTADMDDVIDAAMKGGN